MEKNKFKILMVVPRFTITNDKFYTYFFPMGLAYIVSVLKKENYEVDAINLNHHKGAIKELLTKTLDNNPYDFVLTGGMAITYSVIEKILKTVREHSSKPKIIIGGLIITSEKEFISQNLDFDYGVIDEGEETIINLFKCLQNNTNLDRENSVYNPACFNSQIHSLNFRSVKNSKTLGVLTPSSLHDVKGIVYFKDNKPVFTQGYKPPMDLDKLPFPDVESLGYEEWLDNQIPNKSYIFSLFDKPRMYYLVGSRSCPYQCTFCYHSSMYRKRSVENIFLELNHIVKKHKINLLFFYDECIAVDKKRLKDICDGLKKLQGEIAWELMWIPNLRVDLATDEILTMLKESNCAFIGYGLESYSKEVLESMDKKITPEQVDIAIKKTLAAGIGLMASFIFGDIAETKETASTTLDYWEENCEDQINLDFIRPYPNSKIYQYCIKEGIIKDKLEFMKDLIREDDFSINMTKNMSDADFNKLVARVKGSSISKCRKIAKNISIKKTSKGVYDITVKCPFCKEVITYGNNYIPNRYNFSFTVRCRKCPKRFYIADPLRKLALRNYRLTKPLKTLKRRLIYSMKEKKI